MVALPAVSGFLEAGFAIFLFVFTPQERNSFVTLEAAYDLARNSVGMQYMMAERALSDGGKDAAAFLRGRAAQADTPFERFFAETLARRAEGEFANFPAAVARVGEAEQKALRTPAGSPSPEAVEAILTAVAGTDCAEFAALRLMKDLTRSHSSRIGFLLYIDKHWKPAARAGMVEYVRIGNDGEGSRLAAEILLRREEGR